MEPLHDDSTPPGVPDDGTDRGGRRRPTVVRVAGVSAALLGLAIGAGAIAGAATSGSSSTPPSASAPNGGPPERGTPPAAAGTVKTVGANTFTLTTRDGTLVTVNVTSATTYRDRGVSAPTLANVTVGEHVAVIGTDTANTVAATTVLIGMPGDHGGPGGPDGPDGPPPAGMTGGSSMGA